MAEEDTKPMEVEEENSNADKSSKATEQDEQGSAKKQKTEWHSPTETSQQQEHQFGSVTVKGEAKDMERIIDDKDKVGNGKENENVDMDDDKEEPQGSVEVIGSLNKDNIGPNTNTGQRFFKGGFLSAAAKREDEMCVDVNAPEEEDSGCEDETTYAVLGEDIIPDPKDEVFERQCARIKTLQNLEPCAQNLKRLVLIANCVDKLQGLDSLVNLEHLEMYQNRIRKIEGLEKLAKLEVLDLSFNKIRTIQNLNEKSAFAIGLKKLYLTNNKLTEIEPGTINQFKNLEHLELGANRFRSVHDALVGLENLKELWLGKNKITSMCLPPMPKLETVSFQCNRLEEWNSDLFKNCPNVKDVYFSENNLPDFVVEDTFQHMPKLELLDLAQNAIKNIPKEIICLRDLRELWINSNKIDFDGEDSPSIAGLWKLSLSALYMEHNPCYDQNYPDGGPRYQKTLKKVCGHTLEQLDATNFEFKEAMEADYHGTIYQYRDDSVRGIRKVE